MLNKAIEIASKAHAGQVDKHDENSAPEYCTKGRDADFSDGIGCCEEFRCSLHEQQP